MKNPKNWEADECFFFCLGMIALSIVAFGCVCAVKSTLSDGRPDYCFVEGGGGMGPVFYIKEHVPWRSNRIVAVARDNAEAQQLLSTSCSVPAGGAR